MATYRASGEEPSVDAREFVTTLLRIAGHCRRRLEQLSAASGLSYQQYSVLRILQDAEATEEGPLPTMIVANRMIEPEPGITRMMHRLQRMGFVRRERASHDARISLCKLTRKGQATLKRMDAPMEELYRSLAGSPARSEEIARLLIETVPYQDER